MEVGEDGQVLEQQVILGDVAEDAGHRGRFVVDVVAVEIEGAAIRPQGAVEEVEQGGFAGPATAHDGYQATAPLMEGEVVQAGLAAGETKIQVLTAQDQGRGGAGLGGEGRLDLRGGKLVAPTVAHHLARSQGLDVTGCQGAAFQGEGLVTQ